MSGCTRQVGFWLPRPCARLLPCPLHSLAQPTDLPPLGGWRPWEARASIAAHSWDAHGVWEPRERALPAPQLFDEAP